MIQELREERGREKMALDNAGNRRAEVAKKPAPFTRRDEGEGAMSPAEKKAKEHRDRLLGFQAQNARRTTVRDEAADFETPMTGGGGSMWASPAERARTLKKQYVMSLDVSDVETWAPQLLKHLSIKSYTNLSIGRRCWQRRSGMRGRSMRRGGRLLVLIW